MVSHVMYTKLELSRAAPSIQSLKYLSFYTVLKDSQIATAVVVVYQYIEDTFFLNFEFYLAFTQIRYL